ncbi:hypothetical protein [Paraburkholderia aspalathi]|nr:hypothetical protein [Paraburkholderia aspalathi]
MASQACMCGEAAIPCMSVLNSRDLEFVGKVASIEAGFLSELSVSDAARESIGFAYHTRCLELGISNSPQFIDYFYTNVSDQIAQIYHFPLSSPSWLRKVVTRGGVPPTSVALNGVLVTLLFDSVTDLITAAQGAPRLVLADEETILDCREALLLKIERNYECRFFELKTEFREEFEYLNEYDSSWLRALRNSLSARSNNYLDVKAAWRFCPSKRFDQSLAEHMESRLKVLLDENCRPTKVTFSKLKSGFKCLCIPLAALRNMSISREIVEREVETSERFICRLIRYIIRYREKYPPGCAEYQLVHSISRELRDRLMQGMPEKGMEPEEVVSYVSNRRAQRCCS